MNILITLLLVLAVILSFVGIVGAILPALPGAPLCWVSLLIAYFACDPAIGTGVLVTMLLLTIASEILDYIAPVWMAKASGGSKAAITGSMLGLVAGLFFMPIGLIVGPLVGAFVGELQNSHQVGRALRIALMSLLSFLLSTGFQLVLCLVMTGYTLWGVWQKIG